MGPALLHSNRRELAQTGWQAKPGLPRLQLFEFHDMPWFPSALRLGTTESLRVFAEQVGLAETLAPIFRRRWNRRKFVGLSTSAQALADRWLRW